MIPDRSMAMKRTNLTMLRYQEMPMAPPVRNACSARIVEAQKDLPSMLTLPKSTVTRGPDKQKRSAQQNKGDFLRAKHLPRILAEIDETFKNGPLTINEFAALRKSSVPVASVAMRNWKNRGLVKIVGTAVINRAPGKAHSAPRKCNVWGKV